MWTRRAALVATLPWARMNNLKPADQTARLRILGWAAAYVPDRDWFIQKAIAWWVRDLSKHDAALSRAFLMEHGPQMKPFARKEAAKYLRD
jgi:3-methyladenine DNA glycosylase AlkD